jgi:uncharacterized membrane protein
MTDRNLKLALIVSVAANIFLIGGAAGGLGFWLLRPHAEVREPPGRPALARLQAQRRPLRFAADDLAPAQRQAFRQALREARQASAADLLQARDRRLALADLLAQPSPDRAEVEAAMAAVRQADIAVRSRTEQAVADFAVGLSVEDRARFIGGLKRSGALLRPSVVAGATGNPPPAR